MKDNLHLYDFLKLSHETDHEQLRNPPLENS